MWLETWIELKSGESWGSVWTGLIGAFNIVVCAGAVNGKFVKATPKEKTGLQCCQWPVLPMASLVRPHSGQRLGQVKN